ncbi:hypothetical protein M3Y99_00173800 [Aphelenchoides fujianensis]|nr:hypothetical protein M3Y99_00173800 [Aphelenchoides fujianensis]
MEPDLSFIRPDIRYENARPLDPKAVIPLLNEYLLRVSDIQNACTTKLERAMAELECRLDRTETLLCLLEKRLERVELVTVESAAPPPTIQQPPPVESAELPAEVPAVPQPSVEQGERPEEEAGTK